MTTDPTPGYERIGRKACERFVRLVMTSASGYETPEDAMLHYSAELQAMLADRVRAAVEAEREACAKIAEAIDTEWAVAAAIRGRKGQ